MKKLFTSFLLLPFALLNSQIVTISDKYPVFFSLGTSVNNTSNLYNVNEDVTETVTTLSPGLMLNLSSDASNLNLNVSASSQIKKYQKNDNLDSNYFQIRSSASFSTPKSSLSTSASFAEMASEGDDPLDDGEAGRLLARDMTNFSVNASYNLSVKFSIDTAYSFSRTDQAASSSSFDRDSVSIPLDIYYNYSEKSAVGIGYKHTKDGYDEVNDTRKSYVYLKIKGEIYPKLLANASIGYTETNFNDGSASNLGSDINLTHLYSSKSRFVLGLSRSFAPRATGDEVLDTSLTLTGSHTFTPIISGSASGSYRVSEYTGTKNREDESRSINASINYKFTPKASISGNVSFRENTSSGAEKGDDYIAQSFTLSAKFKY